MMADQDIVKNNIEKDYPSQSARGAGATMPVLRLVLIDDSPEDRDIIRRYLLRNAEVQFLFDEAETAAQGIAVCQQGERRPDCVFLDLHLPDMDGVDVLGALKGGDGKMPFPVLVLTGAEGTAYEGRTALELGAQDFLSKNWLTPESLSRALHNALERFRLMERLQESETRFRHLADAMPQMVWITDDDGQASYFNRRWYDYTGLAPSQTLGRGWLQTIHEDDRERCLEAWHNAVKSRQPYELEVRERRADGEYRWFLARALNVEGRIWYGTNTDIEGRRRQAESLAQAHRQLEESYAILDTLLKSSPIGLAFVDPQFRFVRVNERLAATNGVPLAAHAGRTVAEVVPNLWPTLEPLYRQAVSGRPVVNFELSGEVPPTPGQTHHWLCSYYPVQTEERVIGIGVVVVEITAQKRTTELLQEADRRKDEFLAILAHELRNPLAPLRTGLEILKRAGTDPAVNENIREMMERSLAQAVRLVDDLLDISRINSGKLQLRTARIELGEIVKTAVDLSRPSIEEKRHSFSAELPAESLALDGDLARLAQVIANLLNNAAKYSPEGGQVRLSAARVGAEVCIRVADEGVGIATNDLPRVFDMFAQVESSLDNSQGGLGIGLALAKQLVQMHGGRIEARSEGVGKGSEFVVYLPVVVTQPVRAAAAEGARLGAGAGRRILIADDNRASTDSMAMLLEFDGHEVVKAYNGAEALSLAETFRPEVVLLDIGMPKLNGHEVAQRLRATAWGKTIVLVAMSGWGQEQDQQRSRDSGFDHHLIKPVHPAELARLLASDC